MYLIAACLPALRPLVNATFKDVNPKLSRLRDKPLFGRASSNHKHQDTRPIRAVTIALADPTKGKKGRFNKLENAGDEGWPIDFSGNHPALATCFRESLEFEEGGGKAAGKGAGKVREREDWGALNGIVVCKEYSISTEPVVVDTGMEYVVSK